MITTSTRAGLIARLRATGTLATEPQLHTITRDDATQPIVKHFDSLISAAEDASGTLWLAPSHLQQVLP